MAKEIERKFLLREMPDLTGIIGERITQGYLADSPTVRVRIRDTKGYLTIKGKSEGISRDEYEYEIPLADAMEIFDKYSVKGKVDKTRYCIHTCCHTIELDIFHGNLAGLVIAEIELADENEKLDLPDWLGEDVSDNPYYFNSNLAEFGLVKVS